MTFKCSKCGLCCKNLDKSNIYRELHNGDGICKYLDLETNLCTIYNNRPDICKIDKAYELYFKNELSKEEYYKLNYYSCIELQNKNKEIKIELGSTEIGILLSNIIQKHGEGASQIIQALKGVRFDSDGNKLEFLGRNLRDISKYKINSSNEYSNIKQQAGFSGELIKEARDNKEAILKDDHIRTRTTDGIGRTNDQVHDHVKVDRNNNVIDDSGSQMKMKGKFSSKAEIKQSSKNIVEDMLSDKWDKYKDSPMDIPSEQVKYAKEYAREKANELKKAADDCRNSGNIEKANKLEKKAKEYEIVEENIRDSKVSSEDAINARKNPNKFTVNEVLKDSHNAGIEAAKSSLIMSGIISGSQNIFEVLTKKKSVDEAAKDFVKTTTTSTIDGYGIGASGTALKAIMHSSSNSTLRALGKTNAPAMIATAVTEVGKSLKKYAKGDIDELQLLEELGNKGTGMIAASYGAAIGSIILPGVGTVVGGMIGHTISNILYNDCISILKNEKLSEERRKIVEKLSDEAIRNMKIYQHQLIMESKIELDRRDRLFECIFEDLNNSFLNNNIDLFFSAINNLGNEFNIKFNFKTFEEFDEFMLDNEKVFEF
ncbi:YkgJ family cysteine cluster protein [Clostridium baratii]